MKYHDTETRNFHKRRRISLITVSSPLPSPTSPYYPSKPPRTRWRPIHCRLIWTSSTDARRERDLRVGPHHHRRRKRIRLGANNVAGRDAVTNDCVTLDAGDGGDVVGLGNAADIVARWARFSKSVAGCCGYGVG